MRRPAFLEYRDFRPLKAAALLVAVAIPAYWATAPAGGEAYGGTWFGYALGILAALLVLLLAWYGVRRRGTPRTIERRRGNRRKAFHGSGGDRARQRKPDRRKVRAENHWRHGDTVQGWLSSHIYLGAVLIVLSSLHAGFRFGWNVHTLAYALVLAVAASGLYGVFAYLRYPRLITENVGDDTLADLLAKIAELDEQARACALGLPDAIGDLVARARLETRVGGHLFRQLGGGGEFCPTAHAVQQIQALGRQLVDGDQPQLIRDLYAVLLQKQRLLARVRNDIAYNARMKVWLYVHGPLSVALLAALLAHVLAILIYW